MTRNKILIESRHLFYDKGIANARLQQIEDKTGISVGNPAYHYNTKEAIVKAYMKKYLTISPKFLNAPLKHTDLSDFNNLFDAIYQFDATNEKRRIKKQRTSAAYGRVGTPCRTKAIRN